MINYHERLVSTLNSILPTHYEMTLHSGLTVPCISYMETNNYLVSDSQFDSITLGYSRITYQVKVWAKSIEEIQRYSLEVDKVLRPLGFKRIASGELHDNQSSMIQKIMTYECLALEEYE